MATEPYQIQYSLEAKKDIEQWRAYDRRKVVDAIERHLSYGPAQTSRSRIKQMLRPSWSQFRLRVEDFRVYYDVETLRVVSVLRVLHKGSGITPAIGPDHEAD